jgi:hypothetical protein
MIKNNLERVRKMRRRVLPGGIIEERNTAMGRVLTIPASPPGRRIDISAGAPGWESLQTYPRRQGSQY